MCFILALLGRRITTPGDAESDCSSVLNSVALPSSYNNMYSL